MMTREDLPNDLVDILAELGKLIPPARGWSPLRQNPSLKGRVLPIKGHAGNPMTVPAFSTNHHRPLVNAPPLRM